MNVNGNGEAYMSENKKPAKGRLYYTFGTILLMAVITVCAMNFIQDSRLLNKPAVAASTNVTANIPAASGKTPAGKDGGTKNPETKPGKTKAAESKPVVTNPMKSKPATTKPANPGEEP